MTAVHAEMSVGNATSTAPRLRLVSSATIGDHFSSTQHSAGFVSRQALVARAEHIINQLLTLEPGWDGHHAPSPTPLAAMVATWVVSSLAFDDSATPQVSPGPEGGIDVDWLVGGQAVNVAVLSGGECLLTVEEPDGSVVHDSSFPFWDVDVIALEQVRNYLHKMAAGVRFPV